MERFKKKHVTVYDVAEEAGVSIATVSRVLNGKGGVAQSTKCKVQEVMKQLNYNPNELARCLYKRESKMIGCILPDITNPYYSSVFLEAEQYALEQGYTLVLCNSMWCPDNDMLYLRTLTERRMDGLIYMGRNLLRSDSTEEFDNYLCQISGKIPVVLINWGSCTEKCYHIRSNEAEGFEQLLKQFIYKGYRDIAFIGGNFSGYRRDKKFEIYEELLKQAGIALQNEYIISGDHTMESGMRAMEQLLKLEKIPGVVMAINDITAIGAIKICLKNHVSIPEQIAITGFDDIPLANSCYPALTTVRHDYRKLGRKAVDLIINHGLEEKRVFQFPMRVIERESCKI